MCVDINQLALRMASHINYTINQITTEIKITLNKTNPLQTDPSLYCVI